MFSSLNDITLRIKQRHSKVNFDWRHRQHWRTGLSNMPVVGQEHGSSFSANSLLVFGTNSRLSFVRRRWWWCGNWLDILQLQGLVLFVLVCFVLFIVLRCFCFCLLFWFWVVYLFVLFCFCLFFCFVLFIVLSLFVLFLFFFVLFCLFDFVL